MTQLTPGIYGTEFKSVRGPFGLRCGQMRSNSLVHNAGWYNRNGEKIGWGDLTNENILEIIDGLEDGELFIVLGEMDSFWKFVEQHGTIGSMCQRSEKEAQPGIEYIAEKARIVVSPGKAQFAGNDISPEEVLALMKNE